MLQNVKYYDFKLPLPFPIGGNSKRNEHGFKIPAVTVHQALYHMELLGIDLKQITELSEWENVRRKGRTLYTFKLKRIYDGVELKVFITSYKRVQKPRLRLQ